MATREEIPDHKIFSIQKYGFNKERFWPFRKHEAQIVLDSLTSFRGSTVTEYFANCGFDISGIINLFDPTAIGTSDLIFYLENEEEEYQRKNMWDSLDIEIYLSDKGVNASDPNIDWQYIDECRAGFKEGVENTFKGWTLQEIFVSACFRVYISFEDPLFSQLIDAIPHILEGGYLLKARALLLAGEFHEAAKADHEARHSWELDLTGQKRNQTIFFYRFCLPFFENFIFNLNFIENNLNLTFLDAELLTFCLSSNFFSAHKTNLIKAFKQCSPTLWQGNYILAKNIDAEDQKLHCKAIKFRKDRLSFCRKQILPYFSDIVLQDRVEKSAATNYIQPLKF